MARGVDAMGAASYVTTRLAASECLVLSTEGRPQRHHRATQLGLSEYYVARYRVYTLARRQLECNTPPNGRSIEPTFGSAMCSERQS